MSKLLRTRVALSLVMASFTFLSSGVPGYILPAYGQAQVELRKVTPQFVTEPGCPVEVVAADTQLEVDPFGTPMAARHYIDYRNVSGKQVAAVKFRIGYVGDDGKIQLPYLNAPDGHLLQPGEQASQKWRGERVNPRTKEIKIRVLMVKMGDGSVWESAKLRETASQANDAGGGFQPMQPESAGTGWGGAGGDSTVLAGTPVPLTDTAKDYKAYPERTQTGTVPLSSVQGGQPAAGFQPNAFDKGGAPMTSAPAGAGLDGGFGSTGGSALNTAAPAAAGASAGWGAGTAPSSIPAASAAPAAAAPSLTPGGAAPSFAPTAAPVVAKPVAPLISAPKASDITDPIGSIDSLLGNTKKPELPNTIAPAISPSAAPALAAPAAAASSAAPVVPLAAPAAAPAAVAPVAPLAAPSAAAPAATAGDAMPATAPAGAAPASDNSGGGTGAPPAPPGGVDPFGS